MNHTWDLNGIVEHFDQVPGRKMVYQSEATGEQTQMSRTLFAHPTKASTPATKHPRTLTRTVVEQYGWPLKDFLDLEELVRVVSNAVEGQFSEGMLISVHLTRYRVLFTGHQTLQLAWVLHRDISSGNIIIYPTLLPDGSIHVAGYLIDLDHALKSDGSTTCGPLSTSNRSSRARNPEQLRQAAIDATFSGVFDEIDDRSASDTYTDTFQSLYRPADRSVGDIQPTKFTPEKAEELKDLWEQLDKNMEISEKVLQRFRGKPGPASAFLADLLVTCGSIGPKGVLNEVSVSYWFLMCRRRASCTYVGLTPLIPFQINNLLEYPKQDHYSKWEQLGSVPSWAIAPAPGQQPTITVRISNA